MVQSNLRSNPTNKKMMSGRQMITISVILNHPRMSKWLKKWSKKHKPIRSSAASAKNQDVSNLTATVSKVVNCVESSAVVWIVITNR